MFQKRLHRIKVFLSNDYNYKTATATSLAKDAKRVLTHIWSESLKNIPTWCGTARLRHFSSVTFDMLLSDMLTMVMRLCVHICVYVFFYTGSVKWFSARPIAPGQRAFQLIKSLCPSPCLFSMHVCISVACHNTCISASLFNWVHLYLPPSQCNSFWSMFVLVCSYGLENAVRVCSQELDIALYSPALLHERAVRQH